MNRRAPLWALPLGLAMAFFSSVTAAQERLAVPDARPLLLAAILFAWLLGAGGLLTYWLG